MVTPTRQYSAKDLPAHLKLKTRADEQGVKFDKNEFLERERQYLEKKEQDDFKMPKKRVSQPEEADAGLEAIFIRRISGAKRNEKDKATCSDESPTRKKRVAAGEYFLRSILREERREHCDDAFNTWLAAQRNDQRPLIEKLYRTVLATKADGMRIDHVQVRECARFL